MKYTHFDLTEYYAIACGDMDCLTNLLENTVSQLELFMANYEQFLEEENEKSFRDNLHKMQAVFEMLQMTEIEKLAQEGRALIIQEISDKNLISNHLKEIKPIVLQVIEEVKNHKN